MKTVILPLSIRHIPCRLRCSLLASYLFPITLTLTDSVEDMTAPGGIGEVLSNLLLNIVANPVGSIVEANYIGILAWAVIFGLALKKASDGTKKALKTSLMRYHRPLDGSSVVRRSELWA